MRINCEPGWLWVEADPAERKDTAEHHVDPNRLSFNEAALLGSNDDGRIDSSITVLN
jgi:hypothetical protein